MKIFILGIILSMTNTLASTLYIGDSHSYISNLTSSDPALGNVVIEYFDQQLDYLAACGSRPNSWISGKGSTSCGYSSFINGQFSSSTKTVKFPHVREIVGKKNYQTVIINFGDNMLLWNQNQKPWITKSFQQQHIEYRHKEIKELLSAVHADECIWIGPTYNIPGKHYSKLDRHIDDLYEIIEQAIKPFHCRLIDSRSLKIENKGDGIHHGRSKSSDWGRLIVNQL